MRRHRLLSLSVSGIASLLLITACADDDEPADATTPTTTATMTTTPPSSPPSTTPATTEPAAQEIQVTISNGEATPAPDRIEVDQGTTVRIVVTSDEHDEIHVHGYDQSANIEAGGTATIEFVADQTGLFEVESHELGEQLFQLEVR